MGEPGRGGHDMTIRRELVESRMRGNTHVRFGGRAGETDHAERLALRPGSTLPMKHARQGGEEGQILVLSALVMAFLFLPLSIFVIDTGLVQAGYAELGETLQASAEDGASTIDELAIRSSDGKTVRIDPTGARQTVDRSMKVSQLQGLDSWTVKVEGNTVSVEGKLKVKLLALGTATLTESRSATFAYGQ